MEDFAFNNFKPWFISPVHVSLSLSGESAPENVTTVAPEKRVDATSPVVATGMRTTTENAAGSGIVTVRGTGTETEKERERGNTDTARQ